MLLAVPEAVSSQKTVRSRSASTLFMLLTALSQGQSCPLQKRGESDPPGLSFAYGGSICTALWPGLLEHCTQHTTHYTLHTKPYTLDTAHCTLYTTHCTLHTAHNTLHTEHYTLYTTHCTQHTAHYTLHNSICTLHTAHCKHYALQGPWREGCSPSQTSRSAGSWGCRCRRWMHLHIMSCHIAFSHMAYLPFLSP